MDAKVEKQPRKRRCALPARGGEMAYLDFGPPERPVDLVFSHANGFNGLTYRTLLAPLATELRILAVDLRGHGASTLPADPATHGGWNMFRDDLLAFLDAATEAPVALAGHSMGGTSSLLAAAHAPDRVRALGLIDPVIFDAALRSSGTGESPLVQGALRRRAVFASKRAAYEAYLGRGAFRTWPPEQLADYVEAGFRETETGEATLTCAPAWEAANFATHNYDPFAAFRDSRCPIRILRAEADSTCRIEGHEAEIAATGRIAIETAPGTTHFLPMERPDLARDLLAATAKAL
ncbi:alpha/beta fold hydrolase [Phenylobacterium sp. VNQ135]|uniref:alpha/beta fold hydrolase n=1 Tax=Phenylobacterium sp. VNQ135 TaxID=3400922 RepID=UPI003C081DD4